MTKRRAVSLLDLAIAASVAVVPVLLAVLLTVADTRSSARETRRSADVHVSVREVAALKTFERAIVRRDRVASSLPTAEALLSGVPRCASEWDGRGGRLDRFRAWLSKSHSTATSPAERIAAQLADLDAALARFSSGANRRVTDPVGLDASRWFDALDTALQATVEAPEYPGHTFAMQCSDIAGAVALLARADGRMLGALSWRGTVVERAMSHWRRDQYVEISARQIARANPWSGLSGCVYMTTSAGDAPAPSRFFVTTMRRSDASLCARAAMLGDDGDDAHGPRAAEITGEAADGMSVDDARFGVPPSLGVMLRPLSTLQRPGGTLYRLYTEASNAAAPALASYRYGPNRIEVDGNPVDVGFSVDLTIDPTLQALAQRTAVCYTGRQDVCRWLGVRRVEDEGQPIGHAMLEHAVVRMAAIAIVDVASGRIEALAGALSPCTRQEYDGPGRSAGCDRRLPYPIRYRPDALLNPAVYHDAMPASVIKPIMADAFLTDPEVGARWLAAERADLARPGAPPVGSLRNQLMRSDSARFLDRMFCADRNFVACRRAWNVQSAARAFGWNAGCVDASFDCGKYDLLFGRAVDAGDGAGMIAPVATLVPYGRLLAEPLGDKLGAPIKLRPEIALDPSKVRLCAAGPDGQRMSKDDWEKCRGAGVVDVVAEGWGQGHARSSALGVAGMLSALAAAANGQSSFRAPHVVEAVRGVGPAASSRLDTTATRPGAAGDQPVRIAHDVAEVIMSGLSWTHRAGTARLACEQVFDARTCREMDWIAGKTGTPTFPNDGRSLDDLASLCAGVHEEAISDRSACGPLRPYKWYVAAYRTDRDDPKWSKVIAVLTERNWLAATGRIHGAGDLGPNPAAEIAMQVASRHAGRLAEDAR